MRSHHCLSSTTSTPLLSSLRTPMVLKLVRLAIFLLIRSPVLFIMPVHSQDQSGFISIDCGLSKDGNYTDDRTSLYYVSDEGFIESGISMDISPIFLSGTPKPLRTVRSFPQGIKNCYTLRPPLGKGTNYLVRATFVYGNYDSKNSTPEFDLHLGTDLWSTVKVNQSDDFVEMEMIYTPSADYLYVCLANIGLGTPFISVLELRHLNSSIYNRVSWSLELLGRYYTDTRSSYQIRYKDDIFDRIWYAVDATYLAETVNISTTLDVGSSSSLFRLPSSVMKGAMTPKNKNDPLVIPLPLIDDNTSEFYVYFHIAELVKLSENETREFNISINGELINNEPCSPSYLVAQTYRNFEPVSGSKLTATLEKTARSTLPPIINALEYFIVKKLSQALTDQEDVDAIFGIKSAYSLSKNWQGDPCVPQIYMWRGVNCSFTNHNVPIIITLDLSSSGLSGNIAPSFSNLASLQVLDLSNNSLTGEIPESLAQLPSLRILNLSNNKFTGSVPHSLFEKRDKGLLTLSYSGNPDLCSGSACTKTKSWVVPVAASVGAFIGLVVVLGIMFLIKTRTAATAAQLGFPRRLAFSKNKGGLARYSYSDIIDMTKGFEREIGKGGFGLVYYGCLKDGTEVAVKKLYSSAHGLEQFETEVELLMTICHKNLVCLLGYCDGGENLALIYQYMANGDLQNFLSADDAQTWKQRLQIAIGAAQGLDYLHHGCSPSIVHRDVKTCNILLNEKFEAKVADFGVSKLFPDELKSHMSTRVIGTPGYLDPEYLVTEHLNEKSDVYSFGVVLLELLTGQPAVIKSGNAKTSLVDKVRPLVEAWDVWSLVDPRVKESIQNQNSVWKVIDVAMTCVKRSSLERPKMSHVVAELKECLAMEMEVASQGSYTGTSDSVEMSFEVPATSMTPSKR